MKETPQMRDNRRETAKKREEARKKKTFSGHGRPSVGYDPQYAAAFQRMRRRIARGR